MFALRRVVQLSQDHQVQLILPRQPDAVLHHRHVETGQTILHLACSLDNCRIVQYLLMDGRVDVHAQGVHCGQTAVHTACRYNRLSNVRCLTGHDHHNNVVTDGDTTGVPAAAPVAAAAAVAAAPPPPPPDHLSAEEGVVEYLVDNDNNALVVSESDASSLDEAALKAIVEGTDRSNGWTAVHFCLRRPPAIDDHAHDCDNEAARLYAEHRNPILKHLVQYGLANVDVAAKNDGYTVLHVASRHNYWNYIDYIMIHGSGSDEYGGADVDVRTTDGNANTALHVAAAQGHWQVIELLVEVYNANVYVRNAAGLTPREWAERHGQNHGKVAYLLDEVNGPGVRRE